MYAVLIKCISPVFRITSKSKRNCFTHGVKGHIFYMKNDYQLNYQLKTFNINILHYNIFYWRHRIEMEVEKG